MDYQRLGISNTWSYLYYKQFSVGSANEEYLLTIGRFAGVGTDWFASHQLNGMRFSTQDNDNDRRSGTSCTASYQNSGWWHYTCSNININAQPPDVGNSKVLFTEIKIRPSQCITY